MAFSHSSNEHWATEPPSVIQDLESPFRRRLHAYGAHGAYPYMTSIVDVVRYEDATLAHHTPSLQRFLLEPDQSPFMSKFLGTKDIALFGETVRDSMFGVYSPWLTTTGAHGPGSPEDGSCSSSCGGTWTANPSVFPPSPELLEYSFSGPMSPLPNQQHFYHPQASLFQSFPQDSSMGGSFIRLPDVEQFSQAEPAQCPTCLGSPAPSCSGHICPAYPETVQLDSDHRDSIHGDDEFGNALERVDSIQPSPEQHNNESESQSNSTSTPTKRRRGRSSPKSSTGATPSSSGSNKSSPSTPADTLSTAPPTIRRGGSNRSRSTKRLRNPQPFPCPLAAYGCHTTFSSKNEWKRHVTSKHVLLEMWRCELCPPYESRGPNVFNRKDLFTQHLRRMHGPQSQSESDGLPLPKRRRSNVVSESDEEFEKSLESIRNRCWIERRSAPTASACLFCPETFSGQGSWQKRLDHVGLHMENAIKRNGTALKHQNARRSRDKLVDGECDTISVEHEASNSTSAKQKQDVGVPPPSQWNVDHALEEWMLAQGLLTRNKDGKYVLVGHDANELKLDSMILRKRRLTEDDDAEGEDE